MYQRLFFNFRFEHRLFRGWLLSRFFGSRFFNFCFKNRFVGRDFIDLCRSFGFLSGRSLDEEHEIAKQDCAEEHDFADIAYD